MSDGEAHLLKAYMVEMARGVLSMKHFPVEYWFLSSVRQLGHMITHAQSQAIKVNDFVFVSGQMPAALENGKVKLTEGNVTEKAHSMCRNAQTILEAARSSLEKVVKTTIFLANLDDFAEVNGVYKQYFPQEQARSAIEAKQLPAGIPMELELIALE